MIVSARHGFIFIKSKKTGGSAVEHALAPLCGPEDIVTPAGLDEPVAPGGKARNFTRSSEVMTLYRQGLERGEDPGHALFLEIDRRCRAEGDYFAHMTASEARDRIGEEVWNRSFKFTIERHPYEKAVSQAWFRWSRTGAASGEDFDSHFERAVRMSAFQNARFYCIDGRPVLDRVLRYERLEEELAEVAARFGLQIPRPLPLVKAGIRADRRPAREVLSDDQKAAIYKLCRFEFEFMGYDP
jgi:hypothetical protein